MPGFGGSLMNAHHLIVVLALSVFLGLGSAHAQPVVYDLSVLPGEAKQLSIGSGTLDLYIYLGAGQTLSGVLCEDGDGDELCAADVELTLTGPGEIDGFNPPVTGPAVIYEPMIFPTSAIRLNILQSISPPSPPFPQPLGALSVNVFSTASPENPVKVVAAGQAVDAGGILKGIPSIVVAKVPEPSVIVLLLSGALGLAALHWLRNYRSNVVASTGSSSLR